MTRHFVCNTVEKSQPALEKPSHSLLSTFYHGCMYNLLNDVQLGLSDPKFDPQIDGIQGLKIACDEGYLEIVKYLLSDSRIDSLLNGDNELWKLFSSAAWRGNASIIDFFLQDERIHVGDPDIFESQYLVWVVENGCIGVVESIVNYFIQEAGKYGFLPSLAKHCAICIFMKHAIKNDKYDIAKLVYDKLFYETISFDLLLAACYLNHTDKVIQILKTKNVNDVDTRNSAFREERYKMFELVVKNDNSALAFVLMLYSDVIDVNPEIFLRLTLKYSDNVDICKMVMEKYQIKMNVILEQYLATILIKDEHKILHYILSQMHQIPVDLYKRIFFYKKEVAKSIYDKISVE